MSDYLKKPSLRKGANMVKGDKYPVGHVREMHIVKPLDSNAEVPEKNDELKKVEVPSEKVLAAKDKKKEQAARLGPK